MKKVIEVDITGLKTFTTRTLQEILEDQLGYKTKVVGMNPFGARHSVKIEVESADTSSLDEINKKEYKTMNKYTISTYDTTIKATAKDMAPIVKAIEEVFGVKDITSFSCSVTPDFYDNMIDVNIKGLKY